jgi:hypothetical protein
MGQWNITIRGTGQHHNTTAADDIRKNDAEVMAAEFVAKLKSAGHHVRAATITHGGETDIGSPVEANGPPAEKT